MILGLTAAGGFVAGRSAAPAGSSGAASAVPAGHGNHDVGGLLITQGGYTLELQTTRLTVGEEAELTLRITGPSGEAFTAFQRNHERFLHLVLVARDFGGYRHLHPVMDPDGTWRVSVTAPVPGAYRAFADFVPEGGQLPVTLGADLLVAGVYEPAAPTTADEATVLVDGYTVTLDGGLRPGEASQILVWLGRDGSPVPDLERYLGSYGHLVALRHGDLGYLHVHPAPATAPSSVVAFAIQVPSAGTYQLFFEFQHAGVVRTAEFTLAAY